MTRIIGEEGRDFLFGTPGNDKIFGRGGDDQLAGDNGDDRLDGEEGFDLLEGGNGDDRLFGGTQNDTLHGGSGRDFLSGDDGNFTLKGTDLGSDRLQGGRGADTLLQGDGNDTLTGGRGDDIFEFRWRDPQVALAGGTGPAFALITDFRPDDDTLVFDAAGVGTDRPGADFLDGGGSGGTPGGIANSFFEGSAAAASGEAVMVLTNKGFETGAAAALAVQGEGTGDFIIYFNQTVGAASLLFVDAPDVVHSIARFGNIDSKAELDAINFTADDFFFV